MSKTQILDLRKIQLTERKRSELDTNLGFAKNTIDRAKAKWVKHKSWICRKFNVKISKDIEIYGITETFRKRES